MKKSIFSVLLVALVSFGCALPHTTVERSKKLRVGMTKEQVLEVMGEPLSGEAFCRPDVWFYYDQMVWGDGLTTEDECMPLVFSEGKLVGWGRSYYNEKRIRPQFMRSEK